MKAKSVRELVHDLLDIGMEHWGDQPTADAVVQITADGELFWGIEEIFDEGEGGVVARIVPWPPDSHAVPKTAPRKITPIYDTCDCGGDSPCSHGRFLYAIGLEEPKLPDAQRYIVAGEEIPYYLYQYSELAEMPEWLTTLLILGPELAASLQRCAEDLQIAIDDTADPGTEALGAVYEAKVLLGRLQRGVLALENR